MFNIGDIVFYESIGVCKITDITTLDFALGNKNQKYYVMEAMYKNGVNYVPVDSETTYIRNIITKNEAEELIDTIPDLDIEVYQNMATKDMVAKYEELLKSDDYKDLLTLCMSIYAKKQLLLDQKKKFGAIDDYFIKRAEDMLFEELAAALEIEKDEIPAFIEDRVGYKIEN